MTPKLSSLDHLVLTVSDLDHTIAFYRDVLGMGVEQFQAADGSTRTALMFGRQKINLHLAGAEFQPHAHQPISGSADLCFISDHRLQDWQLHLAEQGVVLLEGPIARTGAMGPIMSLYIPDPDGNLIEISNRA